MAMADYRLCDVCGCKTFYDANLNYEFSYPDHPIPDDELIRGEEFRLYRLGDWKVICLECAKDYVCAIVPKKTFDLMSREDLIVGGKNEVIID